MAVLKVVLLVGIVLVKVLFLYNFLLPNFVLIQPAQCKNNLL